MSIQKQKDIMVFNLHLEGSNFLSGKCSFMFPNSVSRQEKFIDIEYQPHL